MEVYLRKNNIEHNSERTSNQVERNIDVPKNEVGTIRILQAKVVKSDHTYKDQR